MKTYDRANSAVLARSPFSFPQPVGVVPIHLAVTPVSLRLAVSVRTAVVLPLAVHRTRVLHSHTTYHSSIQAEEDGHIYADGQLFNTRHERRDRWSHGTTQTSSTTQ